VVEDELLLLIFGREVMVFDERSQRNEKDRQGFVNCEMGLFL